MIAKPIIIKSARKSGLDCISLLLITRYISATAISMKESVRPGESRMASLRYRSSGLYKYCVCNPKELALAWSKADRPNSRKYRAVGAEERAKAISVANAFRDPP